MILPAFTPPVLSPIPWWEWAGGSVGSELPVGFKPGGSEMSRGPCFVSRQRLPALSCLSDLRRWWVQLCCSSCSGQQPGNCLSPSRSSHWQIIALLPSHSPTTECKHWQVQLGWFPAQSSLHFLPSALQESHSSCAWVAAAAPGVPGFTSSGVVHLPLSHFEIQDLA